MKAGFAIGAGLLAVAVVLWFRGIQPNEHGGQAHPDSDSGIVEATSAMAASRAANSAGVDRTSARATTARSSTSIGNAIAAAKAESGKRVVWDAPLREGDLRPEDEHELRRVRTFLVDHVLSEDLRDCLQRLSDGTLQFSYYLQKDERGRFIVRSVEISDSTIPEDEDQVALDCMTTAAVGQAMAAEESEVNVTGQHIHWTWPTRGLPPSQSLPSE